MPPSRPSPRRGAGFFATLAFIALGIAVVGMSCVNTVNTVDESDETDGAT